MAEQRDMWGECYAGDHAQMSPEAFKYQFCSMCRQSGCVNSASGKTMWQGRIETQEDILLNNPSFADPNDPRYRDVANLDFPNLLRKAMKLEIADRKGDWEPVTELDAVELATDMSRPSGFEPIADPVIVRQEIIRGSAGKSYQVTSATHNGEPIYDCTCQAFEFHRTDENGMCKHLRRMLGVKEPEPGKKVGKPLADPQKAEREAVMPPLVTRKSPGGRDSRPTAEAWNQLSERNLAPKSNNTRFPSEGMMVDGSPPPPPPAPPVDPWAPKPDSVGTVVEVGGSFTLGGGSPNKEDE